MTAWTHDALAADLLDARHHCGEIAIERLAVHGGVLDVAAMRISWSRPMITGYEVKISRADLFADVRAGKFRNYLGSVERLYFAVPRDLVDPRDVPAECGLLYRNSNGWYSRRRAPRRPLDPHRYRQFVQAILFRMFPAPWRQHERNVMAAATTSRCADCKHPEGRHSYGWCRLCDRYCESVGAKQRGSPVAARAEIPA